MDIHAIKLQFAAQLLKHENDAHKAAFATVDDPGLALQLARMFDDPVVVAERQRLLGSSDAKSFLPNKSKQLVDIYALATDKMQTAEDRIKAHRLYAEISGFIEKPQSGAGINVLNQGVMIVRDHGDDSDWEEKTIQQQRTLTGHGSAIN
jgi:hypothetical protein